jgi:imidazolonepropionase-like amidohydrolase
MQFHRFLSTTSAACLAATTASAQDLTPTAPVAQGVVAVTNATVHTMAGRTFEPGAIWFEDGKILGVAPMDEFDEGLPGLNMNDVTRIDAQGLHVWPGIISANTAIGMTEIGQARETYDLDEVGDITPEVNGVLAAGVMPLSGTICGWGSVIQLEGWTNEDLAIEPRAALVINWPRVRPIDAWWMSRSKQEQLKDSREALAKIDDAFAAARAYLDAREADPTLETDIRYESMAPVIRGEKPVFIRAQELEQIQSAIGWSVEQGFETVIIGGRDADAAADMLVRHDVGVIITGTHRTPRRRDAAYDDPFTLPRRLEEAGVRWCLASGGGSFSAANERNLPYQAAHAVAYGGLDQHTAMEAITKRPAEMLGVADRLGTLEPGKDATFFIADATPLEITTNVRMAFIGGRQIELRNKQTDLADKYRDKYRQMGLTGADVSDR